MRLHEQLGGGEPDQEVENLLADWRRVTDEGADAPLTCPDCQTVTDDGERCGECLSYLAGFYNPEGDEV
jgi:hypothetical protein